MTKNLPLLYLRSEKFLNQMVEVLGIIIDRHPKERPRKKESKTIEKIGHISLN